MRKIEAITLDVGHTLLFPKPSLGHIYAEAAVKHGFEITAEDADKRFVEAWLMQQEAQTGLIYGQTHAEARAFWLQVINGVFHCDGETATQAEALLDDLYDCFGRAECWHLNQDLEILLRTCRERHIEVGLLSNWDLRLRSLLDELGLLQYFSTVVISAEKGLEKPDRRIFECIFAEMGAVPSTVMHVGDTWKDDVAAAAALGCRAVWYNPKGEPAPDPTVEFIEIRKLGELVPLLEAQQTVGI